MKDGKLIYLDAFTSLWVGLLIFHPFGLGRVGKLALIKKKAELILEAIESKFSHVIVAFN
jgi:hypothetical protein